MLKSRETGCSKQVGILSCSGDNIIILCILNSKTSDPIPSLSQQSFSVVFHELPPSSLVFLALLAHLHRYSSIIGYASIIQMKIQFCQDRVIILLRTDNVVLCLQQQTSESFLGGEHEVIGFREKRCKAYHQLHPAWVNENSSTRQLMMNFFHWLCSCFPAV